VDGRKILFLVHGKGMAMDEHRKFKEKFFPEESFAEISELDGAPEIVSATCHGYRCACLIIDMRGGECLDYEAMAKIFADTKMAVEAKKIAFRMIVFAEINFQIENNDLLHMIMLGATTPNSVWNTLQQMNLPRSGHKFFEQD
jgi:hypothetical protein